MGNKVKAGNVFNKSLGGKMLHVNPNHRQKIGTNDEPGRYQQRTAREKYGLTNSQLSTDDEDDDSDMYSSQDILPEKPVSALNMGSAHHNIQPKAVPLRWPIKDAEDKRTSAPVAKNRRSTVPARTPGNASKYKIPSNLGAAERSIATEETEDLTEVTAISRAKRFLEEQRELEKKKATNKKTQNSSLDGSGSDQSNPPPKHKPRKQVKPRRHTSAGGIAEKKNAVRNTMVRKPRKSGHVPTRSSSTGGLADRKKALRQNSSEKSSNAETGVFAAKIRQLRKGIGETRLSSHQAKEPKKTKKAGKDSKKSDRDGYSSDCGIASRLRILRGKKEAGGSVVSGKSAKSKRSKTSGSPSRKIAKATKKSPAVEILPSPKAGEKIHYTSLSSRKKATKSADKKIKRSTPPADLLRNNRSSSDSQLNARERLGDMNKRRSTSNSATNLSPYTASPTTKYKDKSTSAATNPWIALKHNVPPPHLCAGTTRQNTLMAAMTMNSQRAREEASVGSAGSPHPSPKVNKNVVQTSDNFDPWSPVATKRGSLSAHNKWGALRAQQHKTKDGAALSSLWKDDDNEKCAPQMPGRQESDDDDTEFFNENDVFDASTTLKAPRSEPAASSSDVTNRLEKVKKMEKEMSSQRSALEKERAMLAFQKESLDIQLRDVILEKDALQQKVKELEKKTSKEGTATPKSSATKPSDALKGELETMKAQIKRIHRETNQVVTEKDKQIRDLQKAASKRQSSQDVPSTSSSEGKTRQRLQGELLQANAKLTEKEETVTMQNKRIMELSRELDQATTENATARVRNQLEECKKHNETLKSEMARKEKDFELKLKSKDEALAFLIEELTKVQVKKLGTTGATGEMGLNDTIDKDSPSDEDLMDNSNHSLGTLLGMAGFAVSPSIIRERLASKKIG